jgi:hypothetical protein
MNVFEHLNSSQIAGYYSGNLAKGESSEVGRHLLRCYVCRGRLPVPALDEFWGAVNTEHEKSSSASRQPFYRPYVEVLGNYRRLAWGSMAFLVLLSISLFILFGISRQGTGEREIAKSFDTENPNITLGHGGTGELSISPPSPTTTLDKDRPLPAQRGDVLTNPQKKQVNVTPGNTNRNLAISPTRGPGSKCADEAVLEMELESIGTGLLLKWRKFPNAAKYHIYVSDDDEILIDEFETVKDTSYVLNRPLDPNKSYRWKIIVTLENGQTVSADSRRFTSKDFQSVQNASTTRRKTVSRCAESH